MATSEESGDRPGNQPRSQWLDVALTVLPPLSLITALLVYFGSVRRSVYTRALGLDVSLLEDVSVPEYLIRSVGALYFPLLVAVIGLLLWLWIDRILRRWIRETAHLPAVTRVYQALPLGAGAVVLVSEGVAMIAPAARSYVVLVRPLLWALAVLAVTYAASLRRALNPPRDDGSGHRRATNLLTGLLVSLLLFWGTEGFAQVVGRGLAQRVIAQPERYTQPILLYSAQDLQIDPAAAIRRELGDAEYSAYRYRYDGLRLVFVDGGQYFLIGRTWRTRNGTLIVLPRDGIRVEFPPGARLAR